MAALGGVTNDAALLVCAGYLPSSHASSTLKRYGEDHASSSPSGNGQGVWLPDAALTYCYVLAACPQITPHQEQLWSVQRIERQQAAEARQKLEAELKEAIAQRVRRGGGVVVSDVIFRSTFLSELPAIWIVRQCWRAERGLFTMLTKRDSKSMEHA
eukprot:1143524-Pelagomonas_calceolata.AAC.3